MTSPAPDRTPIDLTTLSAGDALRQVAAWLDDCDNHLMLRRPGGLPAAWFNLNAAFAVVREAAGAAGTQWHYDYLRTEIEALGGTLDPEDGSVCWPSIHPTPRGDRDAVVARVVHAVREALVRCAADPTWSAGLEARRQYVAQLRMGGLLLTDMVAVAEILTGDAS